MVELCVEASIIYLRQHSLQLLHNPLRRFAIPFRWDRHFLPLPGHQSRERGWKLDWISPDQFIGADGDGFWAFGVIAQGSRDTLCLEALLVSVDFSAVTDHHDGHQMLCVIHLIDNPKGPYSYTI